MIPGPNKLEVFPQHFFIFESTVWNLPECFTHEFILSTSLTFSLLKDVFPLFQNVFFLFSLICEPLVLFPRCTENSSLA